jgi:hypothetical protein
MSKRLEELSEGYFMTVNHDGPDQPHRTPELEEPFDYSNPRYYELGERVSFKHEYELEDGRVRVERLTGEVVRVYNARDDYHVEVDGIRYYVDRTGDEIKLED